MKKSVFLIFFVFFVFFVFSLIYTSTAAVFNVKDYGALGNGITDDRAAIIATCWAAYFAGGFPTVYFPEGVYVVSGGPHPFDSSCEILFWVSWHMTIAGDGPDRSIILRAPGGTVGGRNSSMLLNLHPWTLGVDHDIVIRDICFDGNAVNNTLVDAQIGVKLVRVKNAYFQNVRVKNVRGTGCTGNAEGFHFEFQLSEDGYYENCDVTSDDGGSTASGYSCDKSSYVTYLNTTESFMKFSMGYTAWKSDHLSYVGASGYGNKLAAFHSEGSHDLLYNGVTADGGPVWCWAGISPTSSYNVTITGLLSQNNKHGVYITNCPGGRPANVSISDTTIINCRRAGFWMPNPNKNKQTYIWNIIMKSVPHPFYVTGRGYMTLAAGLKLYKPPAVK